LTISLAEENMDQMLYGLLTEVSGHWKPDIIESFLRSEELDVVLVQEAISHLNYTTAFSPVGIYIPKTSI